MSIKQIQEKEITIRDILQTAIEKDATDVHLVVNRSVFYRIHGELREGDEQPFTPELLERIIYGMLTPRQKHTFEDNYEVDFSFTCLDDYYFRVNVHIERGYIAATIRIMATEIQSADKLLLPPVLDELVRKKRGLILVTGPAGCGKTTTLTYLVDKINHEHRMKVITIEDPIEYVHTSDKSLIVQREVGSHTQSFHNGLKYALRQDPDVVVIGEMRDLESISMALTTAETGHLVLATLHSPDTIESINRIIDVYPSGKQNQIRVQLAENLLGIVGQQLILNREGTGRVLATEVLISILPIRNLIRRGALNEIRGLMSTMPETGMYHIEHCLSYLVKEKLISEQAAREYAKHPNLLDFN